MNPEAMLVVFPNQDTVDYVKSLLKEERMHDEHTIFHHANSLSALKGAENAQIRLGLLENELRKKIAAESLNPQPQPTDPAKQVN